MTEPDFSNVHEELRRVLLCHARALVVVRDQPGDYYLDTRHIMKNGKPLFFGAVKINKRYVSFHLMPVYVNPELLQHITPDLKRRMQGKSCFNFRSIDARQLQQLSHLTRLGLQDYKKRGYIA